MCNHESTEANRGTQPEGGGDQPAPATDGRRITAGTIRLKSNRAVFFAPDSDHSARSGSKKFAVFFAVDDDETVGEDSRHRLRELNKDDKYVQLDWCNASQCLFFAALSAAAKGLKVDIIVDRDFKITDITVPAR